MGYTAIEQMQNYLEKKYGISNYPQEPQLSATAKTRYDLKSAALRFLHDRCEELRFDSVVAKKEEEALNVEGKEQFLGKSKAADQIPYNMEKDIDRLCLEQSLSNFLNSGTAEDAYIVYYCYIVMFLGRFSKHKKAVEFLSEYESNGGKLLVKHRDHFSHSVFVFALGLAIYETNKNYRQAFDQFYQDQISRDNVSPAHFFLKYWGLTALFHDIGYPFELPFEQILSYYEEYDVYKKDYKKRGKGSVYVSYQALDTMTALSEDEKQHFESIYNKRFETTDALLAHALTERLGDAYDFNYDKIYWDIHDKPVRPEKYNYYMDHAYFSSIKLFRELSKTHLVELKIEHIDCLTAILLHNSLFKFSIAYYKDPAYRKSPLKEKQHPLAFLLMLCDELQCWDRLSYGRNTRVELHPMDASFQFSRNKIHVDYIFDQDDQDRIDEYHSNVTNYAIYHKTAPALPAYSKMLGVKPQFVDEVEKIVDLKGMPLSISVKTCERNILAKHTYLSESSFLHLFDFAVLIHARRYIGVLEKEKLEKKLESLSLEYQLSHLNRAKSFARYLNMIHCFYTDRDVSYELVKEFTDKEVETISALEHLRWVREHQQLGWSGIKKDEDSYKEIAKKYLPDISGAANVLREQMRQHELVVHKKKSDNAIVGRFLKTLSEDEKQKDIGAMRQMLKVTRRNDGLRIYRVRF